MGYGIPEEFEWLVGRFFLRISACGFSRGTQLRNRGTVRERRNQQTGIAKAVPQSLLQLIVFAVRHACLCRAPTNSYFGALSCVAPCFFASSAPVLQVFCREPGNAAHLLKPVAASSKCEAFTVAIPSKYKFTGSGAGLGSILTDCSSSGIASLYFPSPR